MESKEIEIGDLKYLEEDLTGEEIVSIVFLLYGAEKPKWILEKLENNDNKGNFLEEYAKTHVNWKLIIIEALAVTQIFECIKNLGVPISEAREFVRKSHLIKSGIKLLYELCESLTQDISDKLINFIKDECNFATIRNVDQLEIFLLHAIVNGKIKIASTLDACDFSMIHNFKTTINVTDQKILEVLEKFPSKPNTLDNSNDSNFNNSSENFMRPNSVEQIQVAMSNTLLGNYSTKKMCVLIINQQNFVRTTNADLQKMLPDHNLTERKGTIKDREALQSLFESFNYHVTTKNDLTHIEVLREVDKITKQSSEYDGLIVCVLSHGHEQIFYGSDSVPIFIRDVKEIMSSKLLLHKPKILLIQACQGTSLQRSVRRIVPSTENDGPSTSSLISGSTRADFLIFWSTIEGFASVRHIDQGSWFIQELVKRIRETYRTTNLLDICTAVIREVSLRRGYRDECMLPKLESTFTQNFRFPTN